ncbi:MAG TPA: peptidylprolyl isomerase [Terriglobales bacterium]
MRKLVPLLVFFTIPLIAASQSTPAKKPAAKKPLPSYTPPTAIIDTTAGKLRCELFPRKAPIGVANFIGLATGTKDWTNPQGKHIHGKPLYDGTIFHRVIPEFMIQGGDPAGNGRGDPGYRFKNETSPDLTFDRPGRLAYANAGPDTNGSQFFITEVPYPSLDGNYTIFGQCDDPSVEIVKQIARMPRDGNDKPDNPVKINHITILHAPGMSHATMTHHPAKPRPTAPKPQ